MTLRPYRERDWLAVSEIYDLSKPDELRGVVDATEISPLEADPDMRRLFGESRITVAEDGGAIVGFAGHRGSFITWLFVHPSFRRRGVASALVKDLVMKLDRPVTLNVAVTNVAAMSLYQRLGFGVELEFLGEFHGRACKAARLVHAAAA